VSFDQPDQNWLDCLRFDNGSAVKEIAHGKGRIFWIAYPVELGEGAQASDEVYSFVAQELNIAPMFTMQSPLPPGVLAFPTLLADSVMYVFVSDSASDADINLRDQVTGAPIVFRLPAEHAAIAVVGKKEKRIVAQFGF
jgi:hypothetical protein